MPILGWSGASVTVSPSAAHGGAHALGGIGGCRGSRNAFVGHGTAGDGGDTTVDDGADGAADRAHGTDRGGHDEAGQDPIDVGRGGGDCDRWVIARRYQWPR